MKKAVAAILIVVTFLGGSTVPTYAAEIEPRESYVFSNYLAYTYARDSKGEIGVAFSVTCSHITSIIGVSSIEIYESDGTHVHTENGTVENGLLRNGGNCAGTYIYQGTSGIYYYAVVNFYGVADGITDSRSIATDTVQAP